MSKQVAEFDFAKKFADGLKIEDGSLPEFDVQIKQVNS